MITHFILSKNDNHHLFHLLLLFKVHHYYLSKGGESTIVGRSSQLNLFTEKSVRHRVTKFRRMPTKQSFNDDKEDDKDEEEKEEEKDEEDFLSCVNSESVSTGEEVSWGVRFQNAFKM